MKYNLLGNTGILVSELCLGAMTFGGKGFWIQIGELARSGISASATIRRGWWKGR